MSERKGGGGSFRVKGAGANSGSLVRGTWGLRVEYQKQSGEYGKVCKVEDGLRVKTE